MIAAVFLVAALSCTDHTYTIDQIDRIRAATAYKMMPDYGTSFDPADLSRRAEEAARTYLCAGLSPEEVEAAAEKAQDERLRRDGLRMCWSDIGKLKPGALYECQDGQVVPLQPRKPRGRR